MVNGQLKPPPGATNGRWKRPVSWRNRRWVLLGQWLSRRLVRFFTIENRPLALSSIGLPKRSCGRQMMAVHCFLFPQRMPSMNRCFPSPKLVCVAAIAGGLRHVKFLLRDPSWESTDGHQRLGDPCKTLAFDYGVWEQCRHGACIKKP
jgi:hypothetical protein